MLTARGNSEFARLSAASTRAMQRGLRRKSLASAACRRRSSAAAVGSHQLRAPGEISEPNPYHARNRKFESTSLQRRVHVSRDFALPWREAGFSRGCAGPTGAARSAETGIARCMAPTGENISVGPNSSTAASMRRWLNEFSSGSCKAEHGPLLVPGKR